jgi:hypothetical protein
MIDGPKGGRRRRHYNSMAIISTSTRPTFRGFETDEYIMIHRLPFAVVLNNHSRMAARGQ